MSVKYRTKGLFFKRIERGEADEVLKIYTENFGKLEILGKGIRKISSKLRFASQLFYFSEIEFVQGRNQKILTDAILIEKFLQIRNNLVKLAIAYKVGDVLDDLILPEERDEKVWKLIIDFFYRLNNAKGSFQNYKIQYFYFFWNLISFLGHRPELYLCTICQKSLYPENIYFNEKEGGTICQTCFRRINYGKKINIRLIKILRTIFEKDFEFFQRLKIKKTDLWELEKVSQNYLDFLSNKKNEEKNL